MSALRLGIVLLTGYLYRQGSQALTLSLLLFAWLIVEQLVASTDGVGRRVAHLQLEHDASSVLIYRFSVERVLSHPCVETFFGALKRADKAPAPTFAEFRALLLDTYARKYAPATTTCEVGYNVKNNLLFKNGQIDFSDHVYHALEIPYRWDDAKPASDPALSAECEEALTIRLLIVNGMLELQVGDFAKRYSPRLLRGDSPAVYQTYVTITSFPLLYFSGYHGMPVRYLNAVPAATASYKATLDDSITDPKKWKKRYADWRALQSDIAAYRVLCDDHNEDHDFKRVDALSKRFRERRESFLAREGYRNDELDGEESWRYPDIGHAFSNSYGRVFLRNMNANRENPRVEAWFCDYVEDES
jgi:hypothetical protein